MIHPLSEEKIEALLKTEVVGRLGCCHQEEMYIVPISYVYDGTSIYMHTQEGTKLDLMRKNPNVCFQADHLKDMANWKSVIAWGRFEELTQKAEKEKALQLLLNRKLPIISSATTHLGKNWPFSSNDMEEVGGVFFRITLTKKAGRFESYDSSNF